MKRGIELSSEFTREISIYISGRDYVRSQLSSALSDLTPAEIAQRILPDIFSIGAIALHIGEAEYYWTQCVLRRRDLTEEEMRFAHMFDAMENDVDRGFDANYLISRLDDIYAMSRNTLSSFTDKDLDTYFPRRDPGSSDEHSLREILQRLNDHESNHRGQIAMIKRIIREEK
ncbi:MAG: DinB family protein [Acidobacteria bacterium]|nr:DinB family protein [Acidobacteriota bacterium]